MHLEFTAEQDELRDGVRTVLAGECPMSLVREVVEKGTSADALWGRMVELGWPALTVTEDAGVIHVKQRGIVPLRDQEHVHRRLRMHVRKREKLRILEHGIYRYHPGRNLTKHTVL